MFCFKKKGKRNSRIGVQDAMAIYHEKQSRELCALHALNNLLQDRTAFCKNDLDAICAKLSPDTYINPHKSFIGFGNYDVNVIMAALQSKEYDTVWFDKRKDVRCLRVDDIFGFILNVPAALSWGWLQVGLHRRHWVAVRRIDADYYNLDSKLKEPFRIGGRAPMVEFLAEQVAHRDRQLLLVVRADTVWYAEDAPGASGVQGAPDTPQRTVTASQDAPDTPQRTVTASQDAPDTPQRTVTAA